MRDHPIPPVTEPFQFRAIGIVRGTYVPDVKEKFTRGKLIDINGEQIDCVVLGRAITLMRRHLNMDAPHLWVVYPRCREREHLHLQISGVWEPSTLEKNHSLGKSIEMNKSDELPEGDDYFSIRGELIYTKPEDNQLVVKIRQKVRSNGKKALPFKLVLEGNIPLDKLRNFVSMNIKRTGQKLVVEEFESMGLNKSRAPKIKSNLVSKKRWKN